MAKFDFFQDISDEERNSRIGFNDIIAVVHRIIGFPSNILVYTCVRFHRQIPINTVSMIAISRKLQTGTLFLILLLLTAYSCSVDSNVLVDLETEEAIDNEQGEEDEEKEQNEEEEDKSETESTSCTDPLNYVFNERDGLLFAEFEDAKFSEDWKLKSDGTSYSGDGYMVWEGSQHLGNPGNGTATFKIKIENSGTYQFLWHSAVKTGNSGSDHNDTWLRFADADDFYGQNSEGTSTVYPKGTGKTPNPEGATADGWFKIYRSGNNLDFKWQSSTFDNNSHDIFVQFDNPGTYLMEISARSSGHGIDKFVLFDDSMSKADAVASTELSTISCD